jgi:hypothetical protein
MRGLDADGVSVLVRGPNIDLPISREANRSGQPVIDGSLQVEHIILISPHDPTGFCLSHGYPDKKWLSGDMMTAEHHISTTCTVGSPILEKTSGSE